MYLEMMRTMEYSTGQGIDDMAGVDVHQLTATNALAYVLDLQALEALAVEDSAVCPDCGASYMLTDRHVTKLGVCPHCLEPLDEEGRSHRT